MTERLQAVLFTMGHIIEAHKAGHKMDREIDILATEAMKELGIEAGAKKA
jgi:hypothetical protein